METAHLPTSAKDGFRTHGLMAERGHAESVTQTASMKGHPHFMMPDGSIEIVEIMPMPGT